LKQVARKSALSYKAKDNNIVVLDEVKFDAIKTKNYVALINALNVAYEKTLLVLPA
jgi:large subunit ribosomal protein L4